MSISIFSAAYFYVSVEIGKNFWSISKVIRVGKCAKILKSSSDKKVRCIENRYVSSKKKMLWLSWVYPSKWQTADLKNSSAQIKIVFI